MRNLLVGNGINCHFDNVSYSSKQIVLRILKNVHRSDFPMSIIADPPYALKELGDIPDLVFKMNLLKENGLFVLEHGKEYDFSQHVNFIEHREYGSVNFSFFR